MFSARHGRSTLVLTGGAPGGPLLSITRIEDYPGFPEGVAGFDLCPIAQEQAAAAGATFSMDELTALEPDGGTWLASHRQRRGPRPSGDRRHGVEPPRARRPGRVTPRWARHLALRKLRRPSVP